MLFVAAFDVDIRVSRLARRPHHVILVTAHLRAPALVASARLSSSPVARLIMPAENSSNDVDWEREFESDGETIDQLFSGHIGTTYKYVS